MALGAYTRMPASGSACSSTSRRLDCIRVYSTLRPFATTTRFIWRVLPSYYHTCRVWLPRIAAS